MGILEFLVVFVFVLVFVAQNDRKIAVTKLQVEATLEQTAVIAELMQEEHNRWVI